jgi:hypothetical protein
MLRSFLGRHPPIATEIDLGVNQIVHQILINFEVWSTKRQHFPGPPRQGYNTKHDSLIETVSRKPSDAEKIVAPIATDRPSEFINPS